MVPQKEEYLVLAVQGSFLGQVVVVIVHWVELVLLLIVVKLSSVVAKVFVGALLLKLLSLSLSEICRPSIGLPMFAGLLA